MSDWAGTGTVIAAVAGPSLAVVRARCRLFLPSLAVWPDATLNAWIGDAIRFYTNEFPRVLRHTLTLVTGTQSYALPVGCVGVLLAEYPAGAEPAEFCALVSEDARAFRAGGRACALRGVVAGAPALGEPGWIVFAERVVTGATAVLTYLGPHWVPTVDAELTSVPEAHSEALVAFVDFRAHWLLETEEAVTVTNVSIILSQLGQEARLAWRRYKEVVDRLQSLAPNVSAVTSSGRVVWGSIGL